MKTGSLRSRVALITIALLAAVLVAVVAAVTLAYRSKLNSDLRSRLTAAGKAVEHARSEATAKRLAQGLALEGISTRIGSARVALPAGKGFPGSAPVKTGSSITTRGSLLVLDEVLPDGTQVVFSASRTSIDSAVGSLLIVEVLVALGALGLATILVVRGSGTALRPLTHVIETATRIAQGEAALRLQPDRTDTELGRMAAAFDHMVDALDSAVQRAQASDAATRRFLADASHELRTPIAALQASTETLLREQPDRPERDRLEAALARDLRRLGRMVDDLLGLARLEARPHRKTVELEAIARPLIEDARTRAPQAQLSIVSDGCTNVRGDADALERLLRNLLDNAIAAIAPNGHIQVDLRRTDNHVEADVRDDGPGVPESEREHIFDRFVRLDPSVPGHGLGLAIARRIARQHHGELTCDTSAHGGKFTLQLPAAS